MTAHLHCFEQGPDCSVCLLALDHDGPHEFIPGDGVCIEFIGDKIEVIPISRSQS